jgi:hypothetical protein
MKPHMFRLSLHIALSLISFLLLAGVCFPVQAAGLQDQTITLTPNAGTGDHELINLKIPFPPGVLSNAGNVRILDDQGNEVAAFVKPLLTWHFRDGSVRAVKVQFYAEIQLERERPPGLRRHCPPF